MLFLITRTHISKSIKSWTSFLRSKGVHPDELPRFIEYVDDGSGPLARKRGLRLQRFQILEEKVKPCSKKPSIYMGLNGIYVI